MYALILKSDENNSRYWICYQLSYSLTEIKNLQCFTPERISLPKSDYSAQLIEELVSIKSCRTGNVSRFAIYSIEEPINLSSKFKFNQ